MGSSLTEVRASILAGGEWSSIDDLIARSALSGEGRLGELIDVFARLDAATVPSLVPSSFVARGLLLRELGPPFRDVVADIPALLDRVMAERIAHAFDPPVVFLWAGGPNDGRRAEPPFDVEHDDDDPYWDVCYDPEFWQRIDLPIQVWGDHEWGQRFSYKRPIWSERMRPEDVGAPSVRAYLRHRFRWTNNRTFEVTTNSGERVRMYSSHDEGEREQIRLLRDQQEEARMNLIDLFLEGLSPATVAYRTSRLLDHESATQLGFECEQDEVVAVVDDEHVRILWVLHDRYTG